MQPPLSDAGSYLLDGSDDYPAIDPRWEKLPLSQWKQEDA
jgi:hypothetical protein